MNGVFGCNEVKPKMEKTLCSSETDTISFYLTFCVQEPLQLERHDSDLRSHSSGTPSFIWPGGGRSPLRDKILEMSLCGD